MDPALKIPTNGMKNSLTLGSRVRLVISNKNHGNTQNHCMRPIYYSGLGMRLESLTQQHHNKYDDLHKLCTRLLDPLPSLQHLHKQHGQQAEQRP